MLNIIPKLINNFFIMQKLLSHTAEVNELSSKKKGKGRALDIAPQVDTATTEALRSVSYTHLTLPTNREV